MYCNQCGTPLPTGQTVCPTCGRPTAGPRSSGAPAAALAGDGRVARHRKLLGVLWIIRGVMLLPAGAFVWFGMARGGMFGPYMMLDPSAVWSLNLMRPFFGLLGLSLLAMGVLSIVAGVGLLQPRTWARILTIVLGILDLVSIPFGTALGIYTLWVLLPEPSEAEFRHLAQAGGVRPAAEPYRFLYSGRVKTTLDIRDDLLRRAKAEAARQGKTLTRMIEEGLTLRLRPLRPVPRTLPPLPVSPHRGGLLPGIDPSSNRSMFDAADQE